MRYDLVRTNALKVVYTAIFSLAALAVFIATGHVEGVPSIILPIGMTIGAFVGVKFAINIGGHVNACVNEIRRRPSPVPFL